MRPHAVSYCLTGIVLFFCSISARAAVFNIADGDVTALKSAISVANANGEDDTIELAATGIYTLTTVDNGLNGLPRIGTDGGNTLTIYGNGAVIQRSAADGTPSFRIFAIDASADVTISGLTISNGLADGDIGGGIFNDGTLTLRNSTFTNNSGTFGGGICNVATLTLSNCILISNSAADGGGIYNSGGLTIRDSTFSGNSAPSDIGGGAIYTYAEFTSASVEIANTTFSGNSGNQGGAICNDALSFGSITVTIVNSAFANNSALQGGAIFNGDAGDGDSFAILHVTNSTLSGNSANLGGGIRSQADSGSAMIANTILNAGATGATLSGSHITSQGHNLSSDNGGGYLTATGDQINTDPKLDPSGLQNNGGPTQTIALLPDSPAINAGNDANAPPRDQRDYLRVGPSDIGAFEFGGVALRLISINRSGNDIVITFEAIAGKSYRLERKLNLTDANWQSLAPSVPDVMPMTTGPAQFTDPGATSLGKAFYRIMLLP